jgi:predicted Zn-dependent protease
MAFAACSTPIRPPRRVQPHGTQAACPRAHSEEKMGRWIDAALRRRYELYRDARVDSYVQEVGGRVARQTQQSSCRWTFRVFDRSAVNAFSFPGGYVYVTRGMLAELGSEAELAAVLGHEIGHVTARHSLAEHSWLEEQPYEPTRADLIHFYERSRDNEREADQLAVRYVAAAGYEPRAVAGMLSALAEVEQAEGDHGASSLWDDHPSTTARIARAARAALPLPRGRRARASYLAAIDGLEYGDDPRHGYVDEDRFVRPDAGFSLRLPDGWSSSVEDGTLVAHAPGGHELMLLFRTRHATIAGARAAFFDDDVRHDELVHERVAGFSALVRQPIAGERNAVEFALFEARGHAFLLIGGGQASDRHVLGGLSPIRDPALSEVHPGRLSVVRLRHSTTLRRLSSSRTGLDRLVLLNHESADAPLPAGRFVKRVVPGSASVTGRGSGTSRPDGDRMGGAGRHPRVEHRAHAREDGHRRAYQRTARREHP